MRGTRRNKPQDPSNNGSANEEEDDTTDDPTAERRNEPQDPQNNRSADEKEDDADAPAEDPIDAYSQKKEADPSDEDEEDHRVTNVFFSPIRNTENPVE